MVHRWGCESEMIRRWKYSATRQEYTCGDYLIEQHGEGQFRLYVSRDGSLVLLNTFRTLSAAKGNARVRMYEEVYEERMKNAD